MTIASDNGQGDPTLVLMHFFGSSHHEWEAVLPLLDERYRVITLDMPGFGRASEESLAPTLYQQAVEDAINANPAAWRAWVLVGDRDPSLPPETQRSEVMPHLP
ncbi:alpha/beta fold hydrolase [Salinicola corii]|uniref:Alpha/beta fold hydrolase n=1 Tax=Salinicola corii TaxID=2606937 RepID=A0A640W9C6_9GAMM|nr:alpha/beta fold hydrolase [Salinicola corii]KAA0015670.1 alpha/beta fold hydrolase [Salinicola corii]